MVIQLNVSSEALTRSQWKLEEACRRLDEAVSEAEALEVFDEKTSSLMDRMEAEIYSGRRSAARRTIRQLRQELEHLSLPDKQMAHLRSMVKEQVDAFERLPPWIFVVLRVQSLLRRVFRM